MSKSLQLRLRKLEDRQGTAPDQESAYDDALAEAHLREVLNWLKKGRRNGEPEPVRPIGLKPSPLHGHFAFERALIAFKNSAKWSSGLDVPINSCPTEPECE